MMGSPCEGCGSVHVRTLKEPAPDGKVILFDVCSDCFMYIGNTRIVKDTDEEDIV